MRWQMSVKLAISKLFSLFTISTLPNDPFQFPDFYLFWAFYNPKCKTNISLLIRFSTILQGLHKFQGVAVILGVLQFPLNPRHFLPMKIFLVAACSSPYHTCMHISTSNYHVSMYGTTIFGSYNSFMNSIV